MTGWLVFWEVYSFRNLDMAIFVEVDTFGVSLDIWGIHGYSTKPRMSQSVVWGKANQKMFLEDPSIKTKTTKHLPGKQSHRNFCKDIPWSALFLWNRKSGSSSFKWFGRHNFWESPTLLRKKHIILVILSQDRPAPSPLYLHYCWFDTPNVSVNTLLYLQFSS